MTEPVRLSKRVAELAACSRREAERYIEGGWVSVNGKVIEEPQFRVATEAVAIDAQANLDAPELVTILYHQPVGGSSDAASSANYLVRADNRASDDASGIKPLKRHFAKLTPVLPLEAHATGLMVLTQDWRILRKLVDNAATVEQEYVIDVAADVSAASLKQLNHRVTFNGKTLAAKVSLQSERRLRVALKGAQPGQIAQMCRAAAVDIIAIRRLRIGRIAMAKLPAGQWRYLPQEERF